MATSPAPSAERQAAITIGDRRLTYLEVGDPHGPLVLHNHGGPSSRFEARVFAAAARELGLRLLCLDRPGMGGSDPQPGRGWGDWAADLQAVADALGAGRFAVTGWSEDGPWALAAAAYLDPARMVHVASIAPASYGAFGANWAAKHLAAADALGGFLALHFKPGFRLMYELIDLTATRFPKTYGRALLKAGCPADRVALADPAMLATMVDAACGCFHQGADGLIADARLLYDAWPFDLAAIHRPVHLWQGTADTLVPYAVNRPVGAALPQCVWHEVPEGGHFIAVSHARPILELAARDLAVAARIGAGRG